MISQFGAESILNHILGGVVWTPPATLYFGLWLNELDYADNGSVLGEVTADSYARAFVTNDQTSFPDAADRTKRNGVEISFPVAAEDWGLVKYIAVLDAETDGNILFFDELALPKNVLAGDTFQFSPAAMVFKA